jgi:peptidoglycan/LPS O-acetylase OafA/YrhL
MLFKGQQIVLLLGAWAMLTLAVLLLFNALDATYYFTLTFLGFLIISALISPYVLKPAWRSRLNYITIGATLIFCLIIVQKAIEVVNGGIP